MHITIKKNSSAERILHLLKTEGPQTAQYVADCLSMTSMGARQHLQKLKQRQFITTFNVHAKVGRPNRYWQLSEQGQALFPNRHQDLLIDILRAAEEHFGDDAITTLLKTREHEQATAYKARIDTEATLLEQVKVLAELRAVEGYMTSVEADPDGSVLLIQNHCPQRQAFEAYPEILESELALLNQCIRAQIESTTHLFEEPHRRVYRFREIKAEHQLSLL